MSSLKELTEDTTDRQQDILARITHRKTYSFFVFYHPTHPQTPYPTLQKMQFKLKDERAADKPENSRVVQLQFYNLEEEAERTQGLLDLKQVGAECKAKIVAFCEEEKLMALLDLATRIGLDPAHTPIILTYPHPHSDFATFTGWNSTHLGQLSEVSMMELQQLACKWIQSAQERVDIWSLSITLHEGGRLERQVGKTFEAMESQGIFQQRFLSHVSLGYHVRLSKNYKERCRQVQSKRVNRLIYGWQSFKNFCCLGSSNMRASTGVVSIHYVDEKGESFEILKHLREYDGSQESQIEASRVVRTDKGILSLVVANIDRYHGHKFNAQINSKPGDGRAEIIVYEGVTKCRKLASVGDEILLKIQSEGAIDIQVGESVYRVWGCRELKIRQFGRLRASINKQVLEC